nr:Histone H4 transcription factor [Ipomoea batatas]
MGCFDCFDGGAKKVQRKEAERLASEEARARAAEAAQKRQEQFEQSAAGRAARAQMESMAKQSANPNKGEPVLKCCLQIAVADGVKISKADSCYTLQP